MRVEEFSPDAWVDEDGTMVLTGVTHRIEVSPTEEPSMPLLMSVWSLGSHANVVVYQDQIDALWAYLGRHRTKEAVVSDSEAVG